MASHQLAAIVTAAGASTRMGDHKALLPWRGQPLVAHQVESLRAAGFGRAVVVVGSQAAAVEEATPEAATVVYNGEWRTGRSSSIRAGAEAVPDESAAVLVVAVDQPLVPDVLEELVPRAGAPLVQPVDAEGAHGHPVVLGGDQLGDLRDLSEEGEGLRSLVRELRSSGVLVEVDELPHWDLNTPEAYRRARRRAADRPSERRDHSQS